MLSILSTYGSSVNRYHPPRDCHGPCKSVERAPASCLGHEHAVTELATSGIARGLRPFGPLGATAKVPSPGAIRAEIMRLRNNGLYAIPIKLQWDSNSCTKRATYHHTWGNIKDRMLWGESIESALKQRPDANGIANVTGASRIIAIDVDITLTKEKRPGIELWNRLIQQQGEPDT
jgi:hypothetical protein